MSDLLVPLPRLIDGWMGGQAGSDIFFYYYHQRVLSVILHLNYPSVTTACNLPQHLKIGQDRVLIQHRLLVLMTVSSSAQTYLLTSKHMLEIPTK